MTSIEKLFEQLEEQGIVFKSANNLLHISIDASDYLDIKRLTKEMHKQEIIDAAERWKGTDFAERYYEETFVSKGSDEHIVDANEMIEITQQKETLYTEEQVQKMIDDALINYELGWSDRRKQQNLYTEKEIRKAIYGNPTFIFGKDQAEAIIQSLKQPKQ